jgi:deazaflavin-dependent oxidoreductase (nitroreductase family)
MNAYQRSVRRLSTTTWFRWILSQVLTPLDLKFRNTPFAPSGLGAQFPLCYLTTTGSVSGKQRTVPLLYITGDHGHLVAATNFGKDRHPGWSCNLEHDAAAVLEIDGTSTTVTARRIPDDEALDHWRQFASVWPGYDTYRSITTRTIRMYELIPRSG